MNFKEKNIFIFEFVTSGGFLGGDLDESLLTEGFGMLSSLISDFLILGFKVNLILDYRIEDKFNKLKNSLSNIETNEKLNTKNVSAIFLNEPQEMKVKFRHLTKNSDYIIIIAPEFQSILLNLVSFAENILENSQNHLILGPNSEFIKIYSNKMLSASAFKNFGYNTPVTWDLDEYINHLSQFKTLKLWWKYPPEYHKRSFIIKPLDGVGCLETFELELNLFQIYEYPKEFFDDLDSIFRKIKYEFPDTKFIIQNKIDGKCLSVSAIKNKDKLTFISVNEQLIESILLEETKSRIRFFKLEYLGGYSPMMNSKPSMIKAISKITQNICENFNFNGFFGLDFLYNENLATQDEKNSITLIEVNPRITTPYIAYSKLYQNRNINFAQEFFKNKTEIETKFKEKVCKFIKNSKNGSINIELLEK